MTACIIPTCCPTSLFLISPPFVLLTFALPYIFLEVLWPKADTQIASTAESLSVPATSKGLIKASFTIQQAILQHYATVDLPPVCDTF